MDDKNLYALQKKFQKNLTSDVLELNFISSDNEYERFDIYKKSIINTLRDILEEKYPSIWKILPRTNANFLAYQFFENNLPSNGILNEWGETFSLFIKSNEHTQKFPFLYDFTLYDFFKNECYKSSSVRTLPTKKFKLITESNVDKITFSFKPSLFLYQSSYPIASIEEIIEESKKDFSNIKQKSSYAAIVQNENHAPTTYWMNSELYNFIQSLTKKETLIMAYEKALKENAKFNLSENLSTIIQMGIICDMEIKK